VALGECGGRMVKGLCQPASFVVESAAELEQQKRSFLMVTDRQIAALKFLIAKSQDGNDLVRRILTFLINASNGMTEEVSTCLTAGSEGYSVDEVAAAGMTHSAMTSANCSTHLDQMMILMGLDFFFSCHYGHYRHDGMFDPTGQTGSSPTSPMRYTFWLARGHYGKSGQGKHVVASRAKLEAINLSKPGLYPQMEEQRQAS
jgi:hypothetical protein